MSERSSRGSGSAVADGLDVHLAEFLATLATAGYAEKTQHDKQRLIVRFIHAAHASPHDGDGPPTARSRPDRDRTLAWPRVSRDDADLPPRRHAAEGTRPRSRRSLRRHAGAVPAVGQPARVPREPLTMPTPSPPRIRDPTTFAAPSGPDAA